MLLLPQISQNTAAFVHTKLSLNQNQSSELDWGASLYFTDLHKSLETVIDHWTLLSRAKWAFKTTCKYFPPKFLQTKNKMATNWTTYLLDPGGAVRGVLALVTSGVSVRVGPGHWWWCHPTCNLGQQAVFCIIVFCSRRVLSLLLLRTGYFWTRVVWSKIQRTGCWEG